MKKIILIGAFILLASCSEESKYKEQIAVTKTELLKMNVKDFELEKYQFKVTETFDKDIYKMAQAKYNENLKRAKLLRDYETQSKELKKIADYIDLQSKATGKTFYRVQAYRIAGDTLNNKIVFLDDHNKVIDFHNKK